jgi:hypothetical protein
MVMAATKATLALLGTVEKDVDGGHPARHLGSVFSAVDGAAEVEERRFGAAGEAGVTRAEGRLVRLESIEIRADGKRVGAAAIAGRGGGGGLGKETPAHRVDTARGGQKGFVVAQPGKDSCARDGVGQRRDEHAVELFVR